MTKVSYSVRGKECILKAEGHATGCQDACAAVSGIVMGLVNYLGNSTAHVDEKIMERVESGDVFLWCAGDVIMRCGFEFAAIALAGIAQSYGDYVFFEKI